MARCFFFKVAWLAFIINCVSSVNVVFMNTEGEIESSFNEDDTAICRCRAQYETDSPFSSAKFEWQRDGQRVPITDGQTILYGDRFSNASFQDIGDNTMEHRVTIAGLDRYDNGYAFYCEFAIQGGEWTGEVAGKLTVNWSPPSAKCSDIPAKAKKGAPLTYMCSVTDVDAKSNGSLSVWKNGEKLEPEEPEKSPAQPTGNVYNVRYTVNAVDADSGVIDDAYACRYSGTGGFEEYNANCTFTNPTCFVQDVSDPCPTGGGGLGSRGYISIVGTVGIPLAFLIMDAFVV